MDSLTVSNREIKKLSELLAERLLMERRMLNEGGFDIKKTIGDLVKDSKFLKTITTNTSKLQMLLKKLQNSEQFTKVLTGITDPKVLAGSIEGILTVIKLNNPKIDLRKIATVLTSELKRDADSIEGAVEKLGNQPKEKEEVESDRGLMGTTGLKPTTSLRESLGGKQNMLTEIFARKLANKLIVK